MKLCMSLSLLMLSVFLFASPLPEAPSGFANKTNGMTDDATHAADQAKFEETEAISDGLGPLYNAQSCREWHQNPGSGGPSQISELRGGPRGPAAQLGNPD